MHRSTSERTGDVCTLDRVPCTGVMITAVRSTTTVICSCRPLAPRQLAIKHAKRDVFEHLAPCQ